MAEQLGKTLSGYQYKRESGAGRFITVFDGGAQPYRVDLAAFGKAEVTFGRAGEGITADIGLRSRLVSRMHGRFIRHEGRWYIENLQSRNGIVHNNAYVNRNELVAGDMYRIGVGPQELQDCVLMLVSSEQPGQSWVRVPITKDRFIIGRDGRCDLVLQHVGVSRVHVIIGKTPQGWAMKDQNTANGTLLNDRRVTGLTRLHEKDVLMVTNTRIIFTSQSLYYCGEIPGISVDARGIVVQRGRGRKGFITSDHVNMSIRPGELVSIIGESGAGKGD